MALKIAVKVGNISNLSDARYCAGMGVEMLGFKIDPHLEDALSPELFNAITGWVSGPLIVGEIESSVLPDKDLYEVSCLQVTDVDLLPEINARGLDAILAIDISKRDAGELDVLMNKHSKDVKYYLLTVEDGSNLSDHYLDQISKWIGKYPIMLAFGINSDNLDAILNLEINAISINGSKEIRPGYKSYDEMADILEALEA